MTQATHIFCNFQIRAGERWLVRLESSADMFTKFGNVKVVSTECQQSELPSVDSKFSYFSQTSFKRHFTQFVKLYSLSQTEKPREKSLTNRAICCLKELQMFWQCAETCQIHICNVSRRGLVEFDFSGLRLLKFPNSGRVGV